MKTEQKKPMPLVVGMLASLATGILMIFVNKHLQNRRDKPPAGAPQLDISNPGTQDEFLSSPTESGLG